MPAAAALGGGGSEANDGGIVAVGGGGSVPTEVLRHVAEGVRDVSERLKPQLPAAWEVRARELLLRPDVEAALEVRELRWVGACTEGQWVALLPRLSQKMQEGNHWRSGGFGALGILAVLLVLALVV